MLASHNIFFLELIILLGLAGGPQSALPPGKKITGSGGGGGGGSYLCFDSDTTCSLKQGLFHVQQISTKTICGEILYVAINNFDLPIQDKRALCKTFAAVLDKATVKKGIGEQKLMLIFAVFPLI